ncbi:Alpha 1,4-glycosyltransferase conserved region [Cyclobacterium lianum]|uniref:Alpha 1,4-glycosyltransferase conserved region n=2 Tax=Cyclobacterium lianum TaxID=388280 RepID=A0A1M7QL32_9BACT|nr:Alpha 1,4-glycosyltransferase conserved region [Cyclobacterium lianum]
MTELEKDCIQSWELWLPEYTFKLWNENNFNINSYKFTEQAYRLKKYAFVSDVCRLYALYHEGGVYLDTDMVILKNIDDLLWNKCFIGREKENLISAGIIGAEKNNSVFKFLLDKYTHLQFNFDDPIDIPTYLTMNLDLSQDITVFPPEYFYPLPYGRRGEDYSRFISKHTYAVHLWNHSWKNEKDYLHDKNFGMALKTYFQRCRVSPEIILNDAFLFQFLKYLFAEKFSFIYKWYKKYLDEN